MKRFKIQKMVKELSQMYDYLRSVAGEMAKRRPLPDGYYSVVVAQSAIRSALSNLYFVERETKHGPAKTTRNQQAGKPPRHQQKRRARRRH